MSFSFDFIATPEDAVKIVEKEYAPESIKQFLLQGISAYKDHQYVHIKAVGHLYNNDYQRSDATLLVEEVRIKQALIVSVV